MLFRVRVRDVDCAFKLFRREVLDKVTIECDNFFVDTELVAKARKWNFRIVEKGVRHYPRIGRRDHGPAQRRAEDAQGDRAHVAQHLPPGRSGQAAAEARDRSSEAVEVLPAAR